MTKYENPRHRPFINSTLLTRKVGEIFLVEVLFNPNSKGDKQVLKACITSDGELYTHFCGQDNIDGFDYSFCEEWGSKYVGAFKLVEATPNPLRAMKVGDMIMDDNGGRRKILEVSENTFSVSTIYGKDGFYKTFSFVGAERDGWLVVSSTGEKDGVSKPKFKIGDTVLYKYKHDQLNVVIDKVRTVTIYNNKDITYQTFSGTYKESELELYIE